MAEACKTAELDPLTISTNLDIPMLQCLSNKGVPLAYVAAQLGHTDTRMVEKHYGHLAFCVSGFDSVSGAETRHH